MKILGIVAEYNPFHKGHLYHIDEAKKLIDPDLTICVMSSSFVQRGEPAVVSKFKRARIAVDNGIDIVIELPLVYTVESADYFAKGALLLLNEMGITELCFGSEEGSIDHFIDIAKAIEKDPDQYNLYVRDAMKKGQRYPDACNEALSKMMGKEVRTPNDLLGLSYVKEVIHNKYPIDLHCIKRTNNYHDNHIDGMASAKALRIGLKDGIDVASQLPGYDLYKNDHLFDLNDFFSYFKYIVRFHDHLDEIHMVDEGLDRLLKKEIKKAKDFDTLLEAMTSKRYTRTRLSRMFIHILLNNRKEDIQKAMDIDYIRLLALSSKGQSYIKRAKKNTDFIILSNITKHESKALDIERKGSDLLDLIDHISSDLEYKTIPYMKKETK